MLEALEKTIDQLMDSKAGWVHRRDAALRLGEAIKRAQAVLDAHKDDKDVDVRDTVLRVLVDSGKPAATNAAPPPPPPEPEPMTLEELVNLCHKMPYREVTKLEDGYQIDVALREGRQQIVYVKSAERGEGREMIHIYTYCGKNSPKVEHWALEQNRSMVRCAFALEKDEVGARMIVVENQYLHEATPNSIKNAVKDVARYGDWLESKLSKFDVY